MTPALRRVAAMPLTEISFRVRERLRTQAERLHAHVGGAAWNWRVLRHVLAPRLMTDSLARAIDRADWQAVGTELRQACAARPSRFALDPRSALELANEIVARWPDAPADAASRADRILAGRYSLLGYDALSFSPAGTAPDWHFDPVSDRAAPRRFWADIPFLKPQSGDHKVIWELNRHQHFLALGRAFWLTGDRRYADGIRRDLRSWLDENPPLVGINWASSLELAFRSLSWVSALHVLLAEKVRGSSEPHAASGADDAWVVYLLAGLHRQLTHVERHLSRYFSPNTHLTGEALALYVAGSALPELAASERWIQAGRAVLLEQVRAQIHPDGGHAELSTCYHRYTLDFYNLALVTATLTRDDDAADVFADAVVRLARYLDAFATDGRVPAIGDDDGGMLWPLTGRDPRNVSDSLALAAILTGVAMPGQEGDATDSPRGVPEEALWLAWQVRPGIRASDAATPTASHAGMVARHFPDSGYAIVRDGRGDCLTFDVGRHGFMNGGHAHADALALTLTLNRVAFLIDPGTATYTMNRELRARMRDSASHNTLTLDGRSSAVPAGPFQWHTRATARLDRWTANRAFVMAEGSHDGYLPAIHRRLVIHGPHTGWLVIDRVSGDARHTDVHWHFDPSWDVSAISDGRLRASGPAGAVAWLLSHGGTTELFHGGASLGWCSPRYGALVPTFAARTRTDATESAVRLVTWIGADEDTGVPSLDVVTDEAMAIHVNHHRGATLTVLQPDDTRRSHIFHGERITSDARMLQVAALEDGGVRVSCVDATRVTTPGLALHEIHTSSPVADLHVSLTRETLALWAGSPPPTLRLTCADTLPPRVQLNGRDLPAEARDRRSVTVSDAHWSGGTLVANGTAVAGARAMTTAPMALMRKDHR